MGALPTCAPGGPTPGGRAGQYYGPRADWSGARGLPGNWPLQRAIPRHEPPYSRPLWTVSEELTGVTLHCADRPGRSRRHRADRTARPEKLRGQAFVRRNEPTPTEPVGEQRGSEAIHFVRRTEHRHDVMATTKVENVDPRFLDGFGRRSPTRGRTVQGFDGVP